MKKLIVYLSFVLLLLASACKKDNNENNPDDKSSLIPASTGWIKNNEIPYSNNAWGLEGTNAMTPCDLTVVNNELALVYSEDYALSGTSGRFFYKVKFTPGQANIPEGTEIQAPPHTSFATFIPNNYTAMFTVLSSQFGGDPSEYTIGAENNGPGGGSSLGELGLAGIRPVCIYPDGSFSMGGKLPVGSWLARNQTYRYIWQYPNTGNMTMALSTWGLDEHIWLQTAAFRLPNHDLELLVSSKDNKVYFSVMENDAASAVGGEHNFILHTRQEIPSLTPSDLAEYPDSKAFILANTVINGKYTFLIGKIMDAETSNGYVSEVSCYQWQFGTDTFTPLYTHIVVPKDLGKNLYGGNPTFLNNVINPYAIKFKDDGTAYTLFTGYDDNGQKPYSALGIINASGAKIAGKFTPNIDVTTSQYKLSTCQYFNGSYYAVVHPVNDGYYPRTDPKFRMEIVKLNP